MNRLALAAGLFAALGVTAAAYADGTSHGSAQAPGYFTDAGAPLVPPYQNLRSDTTAQKQKDSGYFPYAGAPAVAPDTGNAGADSTLRKQAESGYFPTAGAPSVSPTTSGIR